MSDKPAKKKKSATGTKQTRTVLSPRDRAAASVDAAAKKLQQLRTKLKRLPPELKLALNEILTSGGDAVAKALFGLVLEIGKLPDDWKPARGARGAGWTPVVGMIVQLRPKHAAAYADLIPGAADLVVQAVYTSMLAVARAGEKTAPVVTIPRKHLQPKLPASAPAKP